MFIAFHWTDGLETYGSSLRMRVQFPYPAKEGKKAARWIKIPSQEGGVLHRRKNYREAMTLKSLYQLLRVTSHLLDQAADEVHETQLQPLSDNIERIGRALIEVMEVQQKIYVAQPELKPRSLAASPSERDASLLFFRFLAEALELEEQSDMAAAITKYERFIGISCSFAHREIARSQLRRLSSLQISIC